MNDRSSELLFGCFPGSVSPAPLKRHYGCFMLTCRIPLKRLMPGFLSQLRTCYPLAACSDLVNEFISLATAGSAPSHSHPQPRLRVEAAQNQVYSITAKLRHAFRLGDCWCSGFFLVVFFPHKHVVNLYIFFFVNVNFLGTIQSKLWQGSMNLKSTSSRMGENWLSFQRNIGCCFSAYLHLSGVSPYCSPELQSAAAKRTVLRTGVLEATEPL